MVIFNSNDTVCVDYFGCVKSVNTLHRDICHETGCDSSSFDNVFRHSYMEDVVFQFCEVIYLNGRFFVRPCLLP